MEKKFEESGGCAAHSSGVIIDPSLPPEAQDPSDPNYQPPVEVPGVQPGEPGTPEEPTGPVEPQQPPEGSGAAGDDWWNDFWQGSEAG